MTSDVTIHGPGAVAGRLLASLAGLAGLTVLVSCVSCASEKGGAPTKVCGQTLDSSPAGIIPDDASAHDITVGFIFTADNAGDADKILLRTAPGCHSGADIAIEPAGAADIVTAVRGSADKRYIAVALKPHRDAFTVRVTRSPTSVSVVTVKGSPAPTAPASP